VAPRKFQQLLTAAIEREGVAQAELLAGHVEPARAVFRDAVELYRQSWEAAPPRTYGRLVGMLKAAVLGGGGAEEAEYVREALAGASPDSPTASYGRALAALILDDDDAALEWAARMASEDEAFARAGEAITAVAARDCGRATEAITAIVRDFEQRSEHLTGVSIADTALVLRVLAARRGLTVVVDSPLLPETGARLAG
jgi:hypothetical protein